MNNLISASSSNIIPIVILLVYIIMMVAVAVFCRKKSNNLNDFFLAGRGVGGWMSAFAYGTTYFSSVIFVGYAGKFGWTMGFGALWIGIGNALIGSLMAWLVLAKRTRALTHALGARTMPEFFEKRYNSKGLKMLSAVIIFAFLIPYSASVYQGLGYLFESVFKIDMIWCILIMAVLTGLYLFFGGYFATALSDFLQGIIMIVGVILMIGFVMASPNVNVDSISDMFSNGFGLLPTNNMDKGWNSPMFNMVILVLLTSFGVWGLPQSVHKFYAIKSNKSIKQASVVSTVFCAIIGIGAYLVGSVGRLFMSEVPNGNYDMIIPQMLEMALPRAMLGLIVVLVLSASMSTLASLSLSGASAFAVDAYKGFARPKASDKEVNWVLRGACVFFILISVILAITKIDAIVTLMSLSWGVLAGCFLGPYVLGLYSKKITKQACYASMITSLVMTFVLIFAFGAIEPAVGAGGFVAIFKGGVSKAPLIGVICMAMSMVLTYVVGLLTYKKEAIKGQLMEVKEVYDNQTVILEKMDKEAEDTAADIKAHKRAAKSNKL